MRVGDVAGGDRGGGPLFGQLFHQGGGLGRGGTATTHQEQVTYAVLGDQVTREGPTQGAGAPG
ncbi:hypothetical protein APX70_04145, partial [Pseudomonas syringae pv. maculicola]